MTRLFPRRSCLALPLALAWSGASRAEPALPSLRQAAARAGLRFGASPFDYPRVSTPEHDRLVIEQCDMITPVLNWRLISPEPGRFDTGVHGDVVALARQAGLKLTGAHLLWHEAVPRWLPDLAGGPEAAAAIVAHVRRMGAAYGNATWSINVVNEALHPRDGRADGLRQDAFARLLGDAYGEIAFHAAREAFPNSLLVWNEDRLEQDHRDMAAKRRALLDRLDALARRGAPIDAVGLQAHLSLGLPFDAEGFAAFLREIAARGLRILVTELDVLDAAAPAATGPRDAAVAAMYRRFLEVALAEPAVAAVVIWGLSDRYTWMNHANRPALARKDGLPGRPLPFDEELRPKPAFEAMLAAFRAAPRRLPAWPDGRIGRAIMEP